MGCNFNTDKTLSINNSSRPKNSGFLKTILLTTIILIFLASGSYSVFAIVVTPFSPADNNWTNDQTPTFTFNYNDSINDTATCELWIGTTAYNITVETNNSLTNLTANDSVTEGSYSWNITCTNSSNVNASTARTIIIDNTAPVVNINTSLNNTYFTSNITSFDFNFIDSLSNATCILYIDASPYKTSIVTNNSQTTLTANASVSEGSHNVYINCTDNASNLNKSGVLSIIVDSVSPAVNALTPANNNVTADTTPTFTFNYTDSLSPNASCVLWIGGAMYDINASTLNNTLTTLTANASLSGGRYLWNVTCTDLATNNAGSTARNITIDTGAPTVNILNSSFNTTDNTTSITFNFSDNGSATADCTLYFDDGNVSTNSSVLNWTDTVLTSTQQSDGSYSIYVNCTDTIGNIGQSSTITVIIDTTGPGVTINSPADDAREWDNTTDINYTFTDSFSLNATCTVIINGTLYGTNITVNNTATVITLNSSLAENDSYVLTVNCTDNLSNIGTVSQTLNIDRTAPTISAISTSGTASSTTTGTATVTATTSETASCWYKTSAFNATVTTGATAMSGSGTTTHSFSVAYASSTSIGPYHISCRDLATNNMTSSNSTGSIPVTITTTTSSSGGGAPSTTSLSTSAVKKTISKYGVFYFRVSGDSSSHKLRVKEFKENGVWLMFNSDQVDVYLEVGETKLVDINGDGEIDVVVTLESMTSSSVQVTVSQAAGDEVVEEEPIVEEEVVVEDPVEEPVAEPVEEAVEEPVEEVEEADEYDPTAIIIGAIALVIIVVIIILSTVKKKKPHEVKEH